MCCNLIGDKVEWLVFVGEFDDGCSMMSEISDKNMTNSNSSEEHFDFGETVAGTPFADCIDTSQVCHVFVNVASITYNSYFRNAKEEFRTGKCSTTILHALDDTIEAFKVFPNRQDCWGLFCMYHH